jgi:hypothetical protein
MVHREHSSHGCVFAGTCILSRCLAMAICVIIHLNSLGYLSSYEKTIMTGELERLERVNIVNVYEWL